MNNKASLQLGGGNWAAKDANLLAYKTSLSEKSFLPIEFTFERGANLAGTRVDENGLIEKGRENLLKQSNIFNGSEWIKGNFSFLENQTDKDGGTTAWKATCSTTYNYLGQNVSGSGVYTFSGYFRKGDSNEGVRFNFSASTDTNVYIDLTDGSSTDNGNLIYKSITAAGNGFYKVVVTANLSSLATVRFFITNGGTAQVSGNIYIQQFQIEVGLVATDYIETGASTAQAGVLEDLPRIDYTGGTPSLLLEPERTNVIRNSEYLDISTDWGGFPTSNPVIQTQNYAVAPDGTKTASLLSNFITAGFNIVNNSNFRSPTSGTQNPIDGAYTISVYLKTTSGTGTITLLNRGLSPGTNSAQYISCNVTNEWQRFDVTNTYDASEGASSLGFTIIRNSSDTLEEVLVWGAQVEAGSYVTSYIPTHGAIATRGEDDVDQNSSDTFGSGAFSLFFEHEPIPTGFDGQVLLLSVNPLDFYFRYTNDNILNIWNQDAQQAILNTSIGRNANHKICMVYDGAGTTDIYVDGVKKRDGYSYTWPDGPYKILLNTTAIVSGDIPVHISQVMTFETALTNAECITLTTL